MTSNADGTTMSAETPLIWVDGPEKIELVTDGPESAAYADEIQRVLIQG